MMVILFKANLNEKVRVIESDYLLSEISDKSRVCSVCADVFNK